MHKNSHTLEVGMIAIDKGVRCATSGGDAILDVHRGGDVGVCCRIFVLVRHKSAKYGGLDEGRFVWVCTDQISGFGGANP